MSLKVGYKNPPQRRQFVPGKSGNPRGRPKRSPSFQADLAAEMGEEIVLSDKAGRSRKVTKQRAVIKLVLASALANEKGAIAALLACLRFCGAGTEDSVADTPDLEDLDAIKKYVERAETAVRQRDEDGSQPITKGKDPA